MRYNDSEGPGALHDAGLGLRLSCGIPFRFESQFINPSCDSRVIDKVALCGENPGNIADLSFGASHPAPFQLRDDQIFPLERG